MNILVLTNAGGLEVMNVITLMRNCGHTVKTLKSSDYSLILVDDIRKLKIVKLNDYKKKLDIEHYTDWKNFLQRNFFVD